MLVSFWGFDWNGFVGFCGEIGEMGGFFRSCFWSIILIL